MAIPFSDGKMKFLRDKWELSDDQADEVFFSIDELMANEAAQKYNINDNVVPAEINREVALTAKMFIGDLAESFVGIARFLVSLYRRKDKPLPSSNVNFIKPYFSLYDHEQGQSVLEDYSAIYQNGRPLFFQTHIAPNNVLLIFNPPALNIPWESRYAEFFIEIMDAFWNKLRQLSAEYGLYLRRLNYKGAHAQDVYYAFEISLEPLDEFEP